MVSNNIENSVELEQKIVAGAGAPATSQEEADRRKKEILRAIKPTAGIESLPPLMTEPKRVLLIVPPSTMEEHFGRLSAAAGELPMLGLAFIAAALRDQGHFVQIKDYEVSGLPMSQVETDLREFKPDLIGMTAYITNMRRCAAVARIAKEVDSKIFTVLGGPQVTIFPNDAFESLDIDAIVLSEGEIIIRNLINSIGDEASLMAVKGIWFRKADGTIQQNPREVLVDNLDIFPLPALDLYDMDKYFPPVYIRGRRVAHVLTSRGCPFKCSFCETKLTFGRSFRFHSTERVLEELEKLISQGFDGFQFYDDIFTANKARVFDLCNGIIERGWNISWMCYTRTNTVNKETLDIMKRAGCYMISYGVESGDQDLLNVISKNISVEAQVEGVQLTKDAGIQVTATFMLGLPTETRQQSEKTINFAMENSIDYAIFGLTEPYPGTEMWVDALKFGTFDKTGKYKNNLLSEHSAVWIPNGRNREELKDYVERAFRRFYMRPRSLWLLLKNCLKLPFRRWVRFIYAGYVFFVLGNLRKSTLAHRASRN